MNHLELANLLTDYLDGALEASRMTQVDAHLEGCLECRALVEDVRFAMAACGDAADLEPAPWLLPRIVRATLGDRKPSLRERFTAWLRPVFRPQLAYSLSMAIFSLSFILYAAKVNLRGMSVRDVNPATWAHRANSRGHILMARAEKYYYDIRFVYEVQSILQDMRQQPGSQPGAQPASPVKPKTPGSASSDESPEAPGEMAEQGAPATPGNSHAASSAQFWLTVGLQSGRKLALQKVPPSTTLPGCDLMRITPYGDTQC
ncbi:MAG: zf-HC2 domain-containing protein [Candidatus Acidiferrales bacterium]